MMLDVKHVDVHADCDSKQDSSSSIVRLVTLYVTDALV